MKYPSIEDPLCFIHKIKYVHEAYGSAGKYSNFPLVQGTVIKNNITLNDTIINFQVSHQLSIFQLASPLSSTFFFTMIKSNIKRNEVRSYTCRVRIIWQFFSLASPLSFNEKSMRAPHR